MNLKATLKSVVADLIAFGVVLTAALAIVVQVGPTIHLSGGDQAAIVAAISVIGAIVNQLRTYTQVGIAAKAAAEKAAQ